MPDLSIIIVSYNCKKFIIDCISSVKKNTKELDYEIIVVDNNSEDGSTEEISKRYKDIKILRNKENRGFAAANNQGIKKSCGKYILLLNPDTNLHEDSISKMVEFMENNSKVGIASCRLRNPDGTIQPTGGFFPTLPRVFLWATFIDDLPLLGDLFGPYHPHGSFYNKERSLDWVTGAFLLVRREVIDKVGLLDEDFFLYVEEVEYCMRVKEKGWQIKYTPQTQILHVGGASGTTYNTIIREFEGLKLLYKKHYSVLLQILLRVFLFIGGLGRLIVFGIINPRKGKIYAAALTKVF